MPFSRSSNPPLPRRSSPPGRHAHSGLPTRATRTLHRRLCPCPSVFVRVVCSSPPPILYHPLVPTGMIQIAGGQRIAHPRPSVHTVSLLPLWGVIQNGGGPRRPPAGPTNLRPPEAQWGASWQDGAAWALGISRLMELPTRGSGRTRRGASWHNARIAGRIGRSGQLAPLSGGRKMGRKLPRWGTRCPAGAGGWTGE